ncbi:MAG: hypothetical protein HYV75_06540 [Opitutae bacterium]|nr:hypothetical protein [Opitutae bacterium]
MPHPVPNPRIAPGADRWPEAEIGADLAAGTHIGAVELNLEPGFEDMCIGRFAPP